MHAKTLNYWLTRMEERLVLFYEKTSLLLITEDKQELKVT